VKVVNLIPGSGGTFYCENCMRDAALIKAMRAAGHEVLMVPMYLPLTAGEGFEPADSGVFFGGINVYLQQASGLFRRTPRWIDRIFDSPGLLRWAGKKAGMVAPEDLGETTISMLEGENGRQVKELNRLVEWVTTQGPPDLICLSNALLVGLVRALKRRLNAAVICMLQDEDIFLDALRGEHRERAWEILAERSRDVDAFIAVSKYYRRVMIERLHLLPQRVSVLYPGIQTDCYAESEYPPAIPGIAFLARMCEEKGLDTLIEAFRILKSGGKNPELKLRVCGGRTRADEPFIARCRERLSALGCIKDVEFIESFDRDTRIEMLRSVSVLSVPSRHKEAFGAYVLEAWAGAVPVVLPPEGAFVELIEATGGGLLCERNDAPSLAASLDKVLSDVEFARGLGQAGKKSVTEKFSVERMVTQFVDICNNTVRRPWSGVADSTEQSDE